MRVAPGRLPSGRATTTRGYDDGRTRNRGGGDLDRQRCWRSVAAGATRPPAGTTRRVPRRLERVHDRRTRRTPRPRRRRAPTEPRSAGADGRAGVRTRAGGQRRPGQRPQGVEADLRRPSSSTRPSGRVDGQSGGVLLSVAPSGGDVADAQAGRALLLDAPATKPPNYQQQDAVVMGERHGRLLHGAGQVRRHPRGHAVGGQPRRQGGGERSTARSPRTRCSRSCSSRSIASYSGPQRMRRRPLLIPA